MADTNSHGWLKDLAGGTYSGNIFQDLFKGTVGLFQGAAGSVLDTNADDAGVTEAELLAQFLGSLSGGGGGGGWHPTPGGKVNVNLSGAAAMQGVVPSDLEGLGSFYEDVDAIDYEPVTDLEGEELLSQASEAVQKMIKGELPEGVQEQVEQFAAEKSLRGGLGLGEAAGNLTARDLGRTSLDVSQFGIEAAAGLSSVQSQFNQLRESSKQLAANIQMTKVQMQLSGAELALTANSMVRQNQADVMSAVNQLVVANSQQAISGVQQHVDALLGTGGEGGLFTDTNAQIAELMAPFLRG